MGVFDNFPYTNFHEMNLDWVIKKVEEMENAFTELKEFVDAASLIAGVETNQNGTWTSAVDANGIAKIPASGPTTSGTITKNEVSALAPVQGVTSPQNGVWSSIVDVYGNAVIPEASGSSEGVISEDQVESLAAAAAPVKNVQTWQDDGWSDAVDATGVAKIQQANGSDRFGIIKIYDDHHIENEPYMHIYHATDNEAVPVLNEYLQLDDTVLPSGIATPGTYGAGTVSIADLFHNIPIITVDTYGRITGITDAAIPNIIEQNLSIAAGSYSTSFSLTNNIPTPLNPLWFDVIGYYQDTSFGKGTQYRPLIYGTDFTYTWQETDYSKSISIYLTNALAYNAHFKVIGHFTGSLH